MNNIQHKQRVKVLSKREGKDRFEEIHNGIVVALTSHFAKVYSDKKDSSPDYAEWFAIDGKNSKVVAW